MQSNMQDRPAAGFLKTENSAGKGERISSGGFANIKLADTVKISAGIGEERVLTTGKRSAIVHIQREKKEGL